MIGRSLRTRDAGHDDVGVVHGTLLGSVGLFFAIGLTMTVGATASRHQ